MITVSRNSVSSSCTKLVVRLLLHRAAVEEAAVSDGPCHLNTAHSWTHPCIRFTRMTNTTAGAQQLQTHSATLAINAGDANRSD